MRASRSLVPTILAFAILIALLPRADASMRSTTHGGQSNQSATLADDDGGSSVPVQRAAETLERNVATAAAPSPDQAIVSTPAADRGENPAASESNEVPTAASTGATGAVASALDRSAGVPQPPPQIPSQPGALAASAASSTQINLTWTDNSGNELGFKVERSMSASGPWTVVATTPANATAYSNTALVPATTHFYRVRATNGIGDSPCTSTASATTLDAVPAPPSGLSAAAVSSTQINLAWTDNCTRETGFKVERATSASGPWTLIATVGANATAYSNTGLTASTSYHYRVCAANAAGDSPHTNTANATTPAAGVPAAPSALVATAVSSSQIDLRWTDNSSDETGFKVERAEAANGPWGQVATTAANATSYSNLYLTASKTYYYRVRAAGASGNSGYSNMASAVTNVPNAPSVLSATAAAWNQINLGWRDNSSNETGFEVERAASSGGPWTRVATAAANAVAHSDTGLSESTTYYYRVRATNASGSSLYSNTASASTPRSDSTPPSVPQSLAARAGCGRIDLSWTASSDGGSGLQGYKVFRNNVLIEQLPATAVSTTDFAVGVGTSWSYALSALDVAGNESAKSTAVSTINPSCAGSGGNHLWSKRLGGTSQFDHTEGRAVATDPVTGDLAVVGKLMGTADLGGGPLTAVNGEHMFVAKYRANGTHVWSRLINSGSQYGYGVAIDGSGNVYVAGEFQGSVDFGGGALVSANDATHAWPDIFILKYSGSDGSHLWSKRFGDLGSDRASAVAVDAAGNTVITGYFDGTVNFGGGPLTANSSMYGGHDIFVVKLGPGGTHVWSKRFGDTGTGDDSGTAVALDGAGNVLLTGLFARTVDFGGGPLSTTSPSDTDVFVAKLSSAGGHVWSKRFGDSTMQRGTSIDVAGDGSTMVAGSFLGTIDLGGGPFTVPIGSSGIFLAKLSSAGAHVWSRSFADSQDTRTPAVAVDVDGAALLTGQMTSSVDFGGGALAANPGGYRDLFVARFLANGTHAWSRRFIGTQESIGAGIAVDVRDVVVTGWIAGKVDFGGGVLTNGPGTVRAESLVKLGP